MRHKRALRDVNQCENYWKPINQFTCRNVSISFKLFFCSCVEHTRMHKLTNRTIYSRNYQQQQNTRLPSALSLSLNMLVGGFLPYCSVHSICFSSFISFFFLVPFVLSLCSEPFYSRCSVCVCAFFIVNKFETRFHSHSIHRHTFYFSIFIWEKNESLTPR